MGSIELYEDRLQRPEHSRHFGKGILDEKASPGSCC